MCTVLVFGVFLAQSYLTLLSCFVLILALTTCSGVAGGLAICVAVDQNGSVYCLGDKCPPVNQPLSFGKVSDGCIEDPVLGTKFNLKTGQVQGPWCPSGIGKVRIWK